MTRPIPAVVVRGEAIITAKGHCTLTQQGTRKLALENIARLDAQAALKPARKRSSRR
jgi:hypothetical protein